MGVHLILAPFSNPLFWGGGIDITIYKRAYICELTIKFYLVMSVYAYVRVSTQMQPFESQEYEIQKWCEGKALGIDSWTTEQVSGTVDWQKRSLGRVIRRMKPGDVLVCSEISRLGRNMLMIMSILNYCSERKLKIHTIKDNFDLDDNIGSKIMGTIYQLSKRTA